MNEKFYIPSGKLPLIAILYTFIFGTIAAAIGGMTYSLLVHYIPFIYINFLLTCVYGGIVGVALSMASTFAKVRNNTYTIFLSVIFGVIANYIQWVCYIYVLTDYSELVFDPLTLIGFGMVIAEKGSWTIKGTKASGLFLYFVWTVEALIIWGIIFMIRMNPKKIPYCEACDNWTVEAFNPTVFEPVKNPSSLKSEVLNNDFTTINELNPLTTGNQYTVLKFNKCPKCEQSSYLTIQDVTITFDEKGKEDKKEKEIIENLKISPRTYRELIEPKTIESPENSTSEETPPKN